MCRYLYLIFFAFPLACVLSESSIAERTQELKRKDENIKQLEGIIQEKLDSVALLRSEMQLLQVHIMALKSVT